MTGFLVMIVAVTMSACPSDWQQPPAVGRLPPFRAFGLDDVAAGWAYGAGHLSFEPATEADVWAAYELLEPEMAKYPPGFLWERVDAILIVRQLFVPPHRLGGYCLGRSMVLAVRAQAGPPARRDSIRSFHHEVNHALVWAFPACAELDAWRAIRASVGLTEVSADQAPSWSGEFSPGCYPLGLLTPWGATNAYEDVAEYGVRLMVGSPNLWREGRRNPLVRYKMDLALSLYSCLDDRMDRAWFRRLAAAHEGDGPLEPGPC
jgi:hypothetical protein